MKKMAADGRIVYLVKIGQIPSEMDVRTYARIKNVIWDQLLLLRLKLSRLEPGTASPYGYSRQLVL